MGLVLIGQSLLFVPHRLALLGRAVVVLGGAVHLYHFWLLKRSNSTLDPPQQLVTSGGLFPWVRHPMYLGDGLVMLGFAILCPSWLSAGCLLLGLLALAHQRRAEEGRLADLFGEAFEAYRRGSIL